MMNDETRMEVVELATSIVAIKEMMDRARNPKLYRRTYGAHKARLKRIYLHAQDHMLATRRDPASRSSGPQDQVSTFVQESLPKNMGPVPADD